MIFKKSIWHKARETVESKHKQQKEKIKMNRNENIENMCDGTAALIEWLETEKDIESKFYTMETLAWAGISEFFEAVAFPEIKVIHEGKGLRAIEGWIILFVVGRAMGLSEDDFKNKGYVEKMIWLLKKEIESTWSDN